MSRTTGPKLHKPRFGRPEISRQNSIQKKRSVNYVNRRDWTARACNRLLVVVICGRGMDYARESVTCIIAVVVIYILPTQHSSNRLALGSKEPPAQP